MKKCVQLPDLSEDLGLAPRVHPPCLIRVFSVRMKKAKDLSYQIMTDQIRRKQCLIFIYCKPTSFCCYLFFTFLSSFTINEMRHEKTNDLVSDLVQHKPDCTATEDG